MRNRVERLRVWLIGSAGFLLLVIAAFIGTAHYLRHHRLTLPKRLGANIVREANGYTYSQSVQGRTVFTLHASKAVEHSDGKVALHDVSITLYGANQDRNDRIYGDEFEYDQKAGVVRATGLVHIDLQASDVKGGQQVVSGLADGKAAGVKAVDSALSAGGAGGAKNSSAADANKVMHVTTSGLVYLKDLGVAATSEPLEFQMGAMTGHATGADYSRDTGVLMLHSAVSMSGMEGKQPMEVTASTATLDNRNQQTFLTHARYVSKGRNGSKDQTVEAQQATLHTRRNGGVERVEAQGNVTMTANGATVVSQRADVALNAKSKPQRAVLAGGVLYTSDQPLRQMRGQADAATILFDAQGQATHTEFLGAVHVTERTRATVAEREPWSTRDLTAAKVESALAWVGAGRTQLRDAEAVGSARLVVVNNGTLASAHGAGSTEIAADDLKAHLLAGNDARQTLRLDTVAGRGHTTLHQKSAQGIEQSSSGDSLDAKFRVGLKPRAGKALVAAGSEKPAGIALGAGADELWSAVQQGNVSMMRRAPAKIWGQSGAKSGAGVAAKSAAPQVGVAAKTKEEVERATADRAAYDGDLDRVTLSGAVQLSDAESVLWANQVTLDRATGDAHALGAVKGIYAQEASAPAAGERGAAVGSGSMTGHGSAQSQNTAAEPTHVLAERAEMNHAWGIATFYGKPARLWQGGSQVQAPVIELARVEQRLTAHGESAAGGSAQVHTILVGSASDSPGAAKTGAEKAGSAKAGASKAGARLPGVMRIASGGLVYSGSLRQAVFTGGVRTESVDGTVRANEATVYLRQPATKTAASGTTARGNSAEPETAAVPSLAGGVERMVATGQIEMEQPGRKATGAQLIYTASDQLFVLTGDRKAQPCLIDAERGTITGAVLRFHTGDDSVVVSSVESGAPSSATTQRVHTETRVGKDMTTEKGKN
jgi:lipopolysaccharide export system protein LptA